MKRHELAAIQRHPLRELLRNCATSNTPPSRSEIMTAMEQVGATEKQQLRAVELAKAVVSERATNTTWSLTQAADTVVLETLKAWSAEDSLDGTHRLYPAHLDETPEVDPDAVAAQVDDPRTGYHHRDVVTFEDGSQVTI